MEKADAARKIMIASDLMFMLDIALNHENWQIASLISSFVIRGLSSEYNIEFLKYVL